MAGGVQVWEFDANASVETTPTVNERHLAIFWGRELRYFDVLHGVTVFSHHGFHVLQDWACSTSELTMVSCSLSRGHLFHDSEGRLIFNLLLNISDACDQP